MGREVRGICEWKGINEIGEESDTNKSVLLTQPSPNEVKNKQPDNIVFTRVSVI